MDVVEHYVLQLYSGGPNAADANTWLTRYVEANMIVPC